MENFEMVEMINEELMNVEGGSWLMIQTGRAFVEFCEGVYDGLNSGL